MNQVMAIGNGHLILLGPPWKHRECPLSYSKRQGYLSPHWLLFSKGGGMPPGNNFLAGWLQYGGSGTRRAPGRKQEGSATCTWGNVMPACGKWGSLSSKDTDWHSQGGGPQGFGVGQRDVWLADHSWHSWFFLWRQNIVKAAKGSKILW